MATRVRAARSLDREIEQTWRFQEQDEDEDWNEDDDWDEEEDDDWDEDWDEDEDWEDEEEPERGPRRHPEVWH